MKKTLLFSFFAITLVLTGCSLSKSYDSESWKEIIPSTCQSFFDGCNNCMRIEGSDNAACTMMYCEEYEEPRCLDQLDPSWDVNQDGLNDCESDDTCDDSVDYTAPRDIYNAESRKAIIADDCTNFFDGCNTCMRAEWSDEAACTRMYCETYEKPRCLNDDEQEEDLIVYNSESRKEIIDEDCKSFYDGCNNCVKSDDGENIACTMMYCENYQEPKCND